MSSTWPAALGIFSPPIALIVGALTAFETPGILVPMIGYLTLRRFIDQHEVVLTWLSGIFFALFFFATNLYISHERLLWFDELIAIRTAKLPDLATLWQVQSSWGGDSAPILYSLLVRFTYGLSGDAEISIRILSAFAMMAAMMVVFDCARRLKDGLSGLMAMCALCSSFLPYYGAEGRPYMLIVLFTAIALWLWLHTQENSTAAAVAFGVSIFFVITVHFYGVLALAPFAFWDLGRREWLRPSPKLVAGIAGTLCAVGVCAQQIQNGAHWTGRSWCPPSAQALVTVYTEVFPYSAFILAAFILLVCITRSMNQPMGESERLCWLFLIIPIAGFIIAKLVTNHFHSRYLIAMLPGVSVAFACLVSRYLARPAAIVLMLFVAAIPLGRQLLHAWAPESIEPPSVSSQQTSTREALVAESPILADGKKTIIIADFILADEVRHYSKHPELYVSYQPDDSLQYYCKDLSFTCWTPDMVKGHATDLAAMYPSNSLLREMSHSGFEATVKMTNPMVVYFARR